MSAVPASTTRLTARRSDDLGAASFAWLRSVLDRAEARLARYRRPLVWLVTIAMLVWLGLQLDALGWVKLWAACPREPLFYLLVLAAYCVLPVADTLIYRRLWDIGFWASLGAFLRHT